MVPDDGQERLRSGREVKVPRTRAAREAVVILGRAAVERALSHRDQVTAYLAANPREVREAIAGIRQYLPHDVPGAVTFATSLPPAMREAIAGGWVEGAGLRAISRLGLEERS